MNKTVWILLLICTLTACAVSSEENQSSVLLVAFKSDVAQQDAERILRNIFEQEPEVVIEPLLKDPRSLKEIQEKYPQRALRAPAEPLSELPLVYKVTLVFSDGRIDQIISKLNDQNEIEYIQQDIQAQPHE